MSFQNLSAFLQELEHAGELRRIRAEVDPILEITEVADRIMKQNGPALLFENPRGSKFPVLINAFGSYARMAMALSTPSLDAISNRISELISMKPPESLWEHVRAAKALWSIASSKPSLVKSAPCMQVIIDPPNLDILPVLTCWPGDGGPFITLPMVITRDTETGERNIGMYRMHVYDQKTTGMHWHLNKHGAMHFRKAKTLGKPLEVAVVIGCDPATVYAATAPLPDGVDELLFSGFLRGTGVPLTRCRTIDMLVPAEAEILLEGTVDPGETRLEGPFGDHTGYYSLAAQFPVFRLHAMSHRKNALYHATIVGKPPMEDCYMAKATERIFLPMIRKLLPEIIDINLPLVGVFHNLAFIRIKKAYPGHAYKVMHALWGLGQMSTTKMLVIVDDDVDVQNVDLVLWRLGNNVDPSRDLSIVKGPLDMLDHASNTPCFGSKLGIDATVKWPDEGHYRPWPEPLSMTTNIKSKIDRLWPDLF